MYVPDLLAAKSPAALLAEEVKRRMGSLVQVEQAAVAKANAAVLASMDAAKRTRDSHNIAYSQLSESVSNKEAPKSPPGSPKR